MSAFMCSDRHLTLLAAYALRHDLYPRDGVQRRDRDGLAECFGILAKANADSINSLYTPEDGHAEFVPTTPHAGALKERLDPIAIIKACHCYDYQSCEARTWERSEARQLVRAIEDHAIRHLPGYDAAPWSIQ